MRRTFQGLAASPGIAVGPAWVYRPARTVFELSSISDPAAEIECLKNALADTSQQLQALYELTLHTLGEEEAAIFSAHMLFVEDPDLGDKIRQSIETERVNAETAVIGVVEQYARALDALKKLMRVLRTCVLLATG